MTSENQKILARTLIFPIIAIIVLLLIDLKCRIIPWWFWVITVVLLLWWTRTRYNRRKLERELRQTKF